MIKQTKGIIIGIDCSSIKQGGNITHLTEILKCLNPLIYNISKVILWCSVSLSHKITPQPWLIIDIQNELGGNLFLETYWKIRKLPVLAKKSDIVYCPTGYFLSQSINYVAMCRNMLYYEEEEISQYGYLSKEYIKNRILRWLQIKTFKRAKGIIFISKYAKTKVQSFLDFDINNSPIIHHGISKRFIGEIKVQKEITSYSQSNPYKILYISNIAIYKHQWILVEAISALFKKGYSIQLIIVGKPIDKKAEKILNITLEKVRDSPNLIKYLGTVAHNEIHNLYKEADMFVYSSSCENMPNILVEAMTSGLPIASSNMGPMVEFLKDSAIYYDPKEVKSTTNAIEELLINPVKRQEFSRKSKYYAQQYSWDKCCNKTFSYLSFVADSRKI